MYVRINPQSYFLNMKDLLIITVCKIPEINALASLKKQI